jgi:hypothetical protein
MIKRLVASRSVSQLLALSALAASVFLVYDHFSGHDRLSITLKTIVLATSAIVATTQAILHFYRERAETTSSD